MIHLQSITSQKNFSKVIQHFSPNWFISVHIARVTYLYSSFEIWLIIHNVTFGLSNSLSPCTPLLICMPTMGWPRVELPTSTRFARWGNSSTRSVRWFSISAFSVYLCRGQLAPHTTQSDGWNMNDNLIIPNKEEYWPDHLLPWCPGQEAVQDTVHGGPVLHLEPGYCIGNATAQNTEMESDKSVPHQSIHLGTP